MTAPRPASRPASPTDFSALDDCHRQIQQHLDRLDAFARVIGDGTLDTARRAEAAAIEAFFSGTSRQHHADEERGVFPPLLASGDADLVTAVRTLQQDHGWIEQDWIELAPQLRALSEGYHWVDPAELQHSVEVFVELVRGHIELEETLIYPESRARSGDAAVPRAAP